MRTSCQIFPYLFHQAISPLGVYSREIFCLSEVPALLRGKKKCQVHQQKTGWTHFIIAILQNPIAAIKREWCVSLCTVIERLLKSIIKQKKNKRVVETSLWYQVHIKCWSRTCYTSVQLCFHSLIPSANQQIHTECLRCAEHYLRDKEFTVSERLCPPRRDRHEADEQGKYAVCLMVLGDRGK